VNINVSTFVLIAIGVLLFFRFKEFGTVIKEVFKFQNLTRTTEVEVYLNDGHKKINTYVVEKESK